MHHDDWSLSEPDMLVLIIADSVLVKKFWFSTCVIVQLEDV